VSSVGTVRLIDLSFESLRRHARQFVLAYVLIFVVLGFITLPRYGFTWDEGVGDVFFGERYIHFFTSLNPAYLDFENPALDVHQRPFDVFSSSYRDKPNEFLPVGNTLSGLTMELFAYRLGWLDPVDGFHFGKVLLAGLLLWCVFNFAAPRLGTLTPGLAVLILSTFPRFWGDMHFNPLDFPEAVFSALTIFAFYYWSERPTWKRAGLVGILMGCALGSKSTAHFIPIILFFGMFPFQSILHLWAPATEHLRKYLGHYVLMIILAALFFFFAWPYFYGDPLPRLQTYYNFVFTEAYTRGSADWNLDPLYQAVTTMPEIDLVLLVAGIVFAVRQSIKGKSRLLQLLLAWFAIPILRASLPGAANFDGIRHFEEFVPAACLLAAYGGTSLVNLAARSGGRKMIAAGVLLLLIVFNIAAIEARYFPYDYLYYNSLVGGLGGAQRISSDATDYWGGSYRSGVQWLNYNAERDAQVHVAIAPWIVKLTSPIWLRSDMGLIEEPVVRLKVEQGYPVYVMFITRPAWYNSMAVYVTQNLKPVHQIAVDGATSLVIYRLDDPKGIPD
jgi:4-amino-4-deoxy-L-arabinose transferase-like glycosyltransferase